jgi:integrase
VSKSSGSRASRKALSTPKKPYAEFPLTPHPCGKWCKKIRGQMHYFGQWATRVDGVLQRVEADGWEAALAEYKLVADDLHTGRTPQEKTDGLTIVKLCDDFLKAKERQVEAEELTGRMFGEYKVMTDLCVKLLGRNTLVEKLTPDDFARLRDAMVNKGVRGEGWGPHRVTNGITRIKTVFKFGFEAGLMDRPVRYGPEFKLPSRSVLRRHKAKAGVKMFEAAELRAMIDGRTVKTDAGEELVKPEPVLRAMILLGVNCGFGNDDVAGLSFAGLDLDGGWLDCARAKTGIPRRCPLWSETVAAIRAALKVRPKPAGLEDCGLVFLTYRGTRWVRIGDKSRTDYVSTNFNRLLKRLGLLRAGFGFYTLRHVFRTVADAARDNPAVRAIMGHADASIDATYRERIEDDRLKAVSDHVRKWLFGEK